MMRLRLAVLAGLLVLTACHHPAKNRLASLAAAGEIQPDAPLQASLQITIHATPAKIWAILTDIQDWPRWYPAATQSAAELAVHQGSLFSWTTTGMSIRCEIARFVPDRSLAWTGKVLNYNAIHVWTLQALPGGETQVTLRQSVSGFLVSWFYGDRALHEADMAWLSALKRQAEAS